MESLETLAPYTLTTSLRDTAVWETEKGCKAQWTAMGDGGCVDLKAYFNRFAAVCPGVAVNIETIGGFAMELPYLEPAFWEMFPKKPGAEFARFLRVVKRGHPVSQYDGSNKQKQRDELERSIEFCRNVIGLGEKA
jgi:hypothetical protein